MVALWLPPFAAYKDSTSETRYGVNEGLELVEQDLGKDGKRYVVEDADGKELFVIPLRNCLLDTRFAMVNFDSEKRDPIEKDISTDKEW